MSNPSVLTLMDNIVSNLNNSDSNDNLSASLATASNVTLMSTTSTLELDYLNISSLLLEHADSLQLTSDIGYTISLVTSTLAVIILTCVKKLRCTRNHLHLQLFVSV